MGPHTPDLARPVSRMAADVKENGYQPKLSSTLIRSCTNSSYEDICRTADVVRQAKARGIEKTAVPLMITPGFLTDAVGLLLLVPSIREVIRRWGARRMANRIEIL